MSEEKPVVWPVVGSRWVNVKYSDRVLTITEINPKCGLRRNVVGRVVWSGGKNHTMAKNDDIGGAHDYATSIEVFEIIWRPA